MITCQPLEITSGPVNSVQVNPVNYMYIQFTGSTSPPLSSWLFRSVRWRHAWPGCATLAVAGIEHQQAECLLNGTCFSPERSDTAQQTQGYTRHSTNWCCFNVGQRRRRWPNIETVLDECLVFAGRTSSYFYRSVGIRYSLPTCPKNTRWYIIM